MASGVCYIYRNGKLEREKHPEFHVRGPSKVYRKECWDKIGGLVKHLGWDTIDEIKAQYYGWETKSFQDLKIIHQRITGDNTGPFKWSIKLGQSDFYCGYHPIFVMVKGIWRCFFHRPYFISGIGLLLGYFQCIISNKKIIMEKEFVQFLRREQIRKLTFRPGIWK